MCIIIALPPSKHIKNEITKEVLEKCWESNQDGGGYSFVCCNKEKETIIHTEKGFFHFETFYEHFTKHRAKHITSKFLIHFRFGTCGDISEDNCHPFEIEKDKVVMAHNGHIISLSEDKNKGKSDSRVWAEFLSNLPKEWYSNSAYIFLVTEFLSTTNKMALLTIKNDIIIFNQDKWFKENDILFSSDYYKKFRIQPRIITISKEEIKELPFKSELSKSADNNQDDISKTIPFHTNKKEKCCFCYCDLIENEHVVCSNCDQTIS